MQVMNTKDYFDNQISERFRDFQPEPPAEAWQVIEKQINVTPISSRFSVWMRAAAAIAALFTALFSLWFLGDNTQTVLVSTGEHLPGENYRDAYTRSNDPVAVASAIAPLPGESAGQMPLVTTDSDRPAALKPAEAVMPMNSRLAALAINQGEMLAYRQQAAEPTAIWYDNPVQLFELAFAEPVRKPGVVFGAHVITQYNYRHLIQPGKFGYGGIPFESLEEPLYTMSYGLSVDLRISDRWSIQTGMNYRNMGLYLNEIMSYNAPDGAPLFDLNPHSTFHPQTIITSQGSIRLLEPTLYFADGQSFRVLTNKQFINNQDPKSLAFRDNGLSQYSSFLEIPLVARLKIIDMPLGIHLKGGISGTWLLDNGVYLGRNFMQASIGETYGMRTINFSAIGGFALSFPLTNRLTLHLEPTGQIFMMPQVNNVLLSGKVLPYNFSVFSAISFGF